jgi:hypothetical protein
VFASGVKGHGQLKAVKSQKVVQSAIQVMEGEPRKALAQMKTVFKVKTNNITKPGKGVNKGRKF